MPRPGPVPRRTFLKLTGASAVGAVIAPRLIADRVAAAGPIGALDPVRQPRFVNPLPNPLDPTFIFRPTIPGRNHYEIGIHQLSTRRSACATRRPVVRCSRPSGATATRISRPPIPAGPSSPAATSR